jgi:hypothetical protein
VALALLLLAEATGGLDRWEGGEVRIIVIETLCVVSYDDPRRFPRRNPIAIYS